MGLFEYVIVLRSIVIGLALTHPDAGRGAPGSGGCTWLAPLCVVG